MYSANSSRSSLKVHDCFFSLWRFFSMMFVYLQSCCCSKQHKCFISFSFVIYLTSIFMVNQPCSYRFVRTIIMILPLWRISKRRAPRKSVLRSANALKNLPVCHEDWWSSPQPNGLEDSLGKLFFISPFFNRLRHSENENALGSTHGTVGLNDKRKRRTSPCDG